MTGPLRPLAATGCTRRWTFTWRQRLPDSPCNLYADTALNISWTRARDAELDAARSTFEADARRNLYSPLSTATHSTLPASNAFLLPRITGTLRRIRWRRRAWQDGREIACLA